MAMGAAVVAIAQVSAVGGQRGSSNLQRFIEHHPSTFTGGGEPVAVDLATFRLEGESQIWWDWVKVLRDLEVMT